MEKGKGRQDRGLLCPRLEGDEFDVLKAELDGDGGCPNSGTIGVSTRVPGGGRKESKADSAVKQFYFLFQIEKEAGWGFGGEMEEPGVGWGTRGGATLTPLP